MQPLRIELELGGLRQPFKQALHTVAQLGGEAVEIGGRKDLFAVELWHAELRQLRKMLNARNVPACLVARGRGVGTPIVERIVEDFSLLGTLHNLHSEVASR